MTNKELGDWLEKAMEDESEGLITDEQFLDILATIRDELQAA